MPDWLNKEKIVFALAALLAAWGIYGYATAERERLDIPRGKSLEERAAAFQSPDLRLGEDERVLVGTRDVFAQPVAEKRVKPLDLPSPPLALAPVVAPPPLPGPPPTKWSGLRLPTLPAAKTGGDAGVANATEEKTETTEKTEPVDPATVYDAIYLRRDAQPIYGKIRNESPLDLVALQLDDEENKLVLKRDATLEFDIYNHNDGKRAAARRYAPDDFAYFSLAATPENLYAIKRWALPAEDVRGRLAIARWLVSVGEVKKAEAEYRQALQLDPRFRRGYLELGQVLEREYLWEEALACYSLAAENGVDHPEIAYREGLLLKRFGMVREAEAIFRRVLRRARDHVRAYVALGECLIALDRVDEAIRVLKQAHGASAPAGNQVLDAVWVDASLALGRAHLVNGDFKEASGYFRAVFEQDESQRGARQALGASLYAMNASKAEAALDVLQAEPAEVLTRTMLIDRGFALAAAGYFAAARTAFERAREDDPIHAWAAQVGLGFVAECEGDAEAAIERYTDALNGNPTAHYPRLAIGRILRKQGDTDQARTILERLIADVPGAVDGLTELARCALDDKQPLDAIRYLEKALRVEPDALHIRATYGAALLRANREQEATRVFEAVLAKRDDDPLVLVNMATIHYRNGEVEKALGNLQTVEEVAANDPVAAPLLKFAKRTAIAIDENNRKRIVTEAFDSAELDATWEVDKPNGINVRVTEGKVRFEGTQRNNDGETSLLRVIALGEMEQFDIAIEIAEKAKARFGVEAVVRAGSRRNRRTIRAGVQFVRRSRGQVAYRVHQEGQWQDWQPVSVTWPRQGAVRLGLARADEFGAEWNLLVNGRAVKKVDIRGFRGVEREAYVGVFGTAKIGTDWQAVVDDAQMILKKKRQ